MQWPARPFGAAQIENPTGDTIHVTINNINGDLIFHEFKTISAGKYVCQAENGEYPDVPGSHKAIALSPIIDINAKKIRNFDNSSTYEDAELSYMKMQCMNKGDDTSPGTKFIWYHRNPHKNLDMDNGRMFIDSTGNLHFSHLKHSDTSDVKGPYFCGVDVDNGTIIPVRSVLLSVSPPKKPKSNLPHIEYVNNQEINLSETANLECVFKGNATIRWYDTSGKSFKSSPKGRFKISKYGHRLTISNVTETDAGNYICQANNLVNVSVSLKVTSPPIWSEHQFKPQDVTVYVGENVTFSCYAHSVADRRPLTPIWLINGNVLQRDIAMADNVNNFTLSEDGRRLTVVEVRKVTSAICVQCIVSNTVGQSLANGCITVLNPPIGINDVTPHKLGQFSDGVLQVNDVRVIYTAQLKVKDDRSLDEGDPCKAPVDEGKSASGLSTLAIVIIVTVCVVALVLFLVTVLYIVPMCRRRTYWMFTGGPH